MFPSSPWTQFVVPVAVELVPVERQGVHLGLGDRLAGGTFARVESGLDPESGRGPGVADQVDDGLEGAQRLAPPVLRDVAEQPVLDPVPLAGARREVADAHLPETRLAPRSAIGMPPSSRGRGASQAHARSDAPARSPAGR